MSTKKVMEELAKVPLFSDCSNRDLQTIAAWSRTSTTGPAR